MLNRKYRKFALATFLSLSAPAALGEEPGYDWYVQSTLGLAKSRASTGDLNSQFDQAGLDARVTAFDDSDPGYGLALGYQWRDNWSVEGGLRNLGEFAIDVTAQTTDAQALYSTIENLHPESAKGFFAALNYRLLLGTRWSATAKIGALSWRGDYDTTLIQADQPHVGDERQTGTDLFFGLAGAFHLNSRWQTDLGWERYRFDNHDVDYFYAGLTYRFWEQKKPPVSTTITAAPSPQEAVKPAPEPSTPPPISQAECRFFSGSLAGVNFPNNSTYLDDSAKENLRAALTVMRLYPHLKIDIQAHTDSIGSQEANRLLSDARANAVRTYFIEQEIEPARMTATGLGELFPIKSNSTPEERAANRRVELKLLNPEACQNP